MTRYAKKMLTRMIEEGKPLSKTFKRNLGPSYPGSDVELSEGSDSD